MRTIWKYQLYGQVYSYTIHNIVAGAIPLHVGVQHEDVFIWFRVETNNPPSQKTIQIRGTGQSLNGEEGAYIGTIQLPNGDVWHYFDELPRHDEFEEDPMKAFAAAMTKESLYTEN